MARGLALRPFEAAPPECEAPGTSGTIGRSRLGGGLALDCQNGVRLIRAADITPASESGRRMQNQRRKRPIGIWILTIWVGLNAGLIPAITALALFFRDREALKLVPTSFLALALIASCAVFASAVAAWTGDNRGRWAFLGLAVAYYVAVAVNSFSIASAGVGLEQREAFFWTRAIRAVLVACVVTWYFLLNRNARLFYQTGMVGAAGPRKPNPEAS